MACHLLLSCGETEYIPYAWRRVCCMEKVEGEAQLKLTKGQRRDRDTKARKGELVAFGTSLEAAAALLAHSSLAHVAASGPASPETGATEKVLTDPPTTCASSRRWPAEAVPDVDGCRSRYGCREKQQFHIDSVGSRRSELDGLGFGSALEVRERRGPL